MLRMIGLLTFFMCVSNGLGVAGEVGAAAQWVWSSPFPKAGEMIRLRREINLVQPIRRAELRGLADDHATVLIDGQLVDHIQGHRKFTILDLKKSLHQGTHTLEVAADNQAGAAGVWMQLDILDASGAAQRIVTDGHWEARVRGL